MYLMRESSLLCDLNKRMQREAKMYFYRLLVKVIEMIESNSFSIAGWIREENIPVGRSWAVLGSERGGGFEWTIFGE